MRDRGSTTSLTYSVKIDGMQVSDWQERSWEDDLGVFRFADGMLTVQPKQDFADLHAADRAIRSRLRDMELDRLIEGERMSFQLAFAATPDHAHVISIVEAHATVQVSGYPEYETKRQFPAPREGSRANDLKEKAAQRWYQFRKGKEPLQGASYFILTLLEDDAGGRQRASEQFRISRGVLDNLGRLSSTKGTDETARKADYEEIAPHEERWIEAAIPRIIRRLGEEDVESRPPITMANLPSLKE